jgi:hypothetical protein
MIGDPPPVRELVMRVAAEDPSVEEIANRLRGINRLRGTNRPSGTS